MTQDKMDAHNTKKFSMFAVAILSIFLMISMVSALSLDATPSIVTLSESNNFSTSVTINGTENFTLTSASSDIFSVGPDEVEGTYSTLDSTTNTNSITFDISLTETNFDFNGVETLTFTGINSTNSSDSVEVDVNIEMQNNGDLQISSLDFNVDVGFGEDDEFWYPLDEVEVEFDVENEGDGDIENIEIMACLFDLDAGECVLDEDDMDLSENDFDLEENDDFTLTISFFLDPEELNEDSDNYEFYVSAIGEIDNNDNEALDGQDTGISASSGEVELVSETFVILDDISFTPSTVACGDDVELRADVWNIDNSDLEDDEVFLEIRNDELRIFETVEFTTGIDAFDFQQISFTFEVPEDATEKTYGLQISVYDDEDMDDNDIYENGEGDEARYKALLEVESCSLSQRLIVSAELASEAMEGEPLVVKSTITNIGSSTETYTLGASGYNTWANSVELSRNTVTLAEGDAAEVTYTFDVMDDAEGVQEFTLDVLSEDGQTMNQQVQVNIEPSGFLGITGAAIGSSGFLWGLGLLNIILVLVIIFVAIRVARK